MFLIDRISQYMYFVYMKTTLDIRKEQADFLIEYANGGSFTIKRQNKNIEVSGRGLKSIYENGMMEVTERLLNKLSSIYKVECNF